ncbi:MAG: alpha/beta hydrolase family protein [Rudaea sp.]
MKFARNVLGALLFVGAAVALAAEAPDFARHPKYDVVKISPNGDYLALTGIVGDKTMLGLVHLPDMKTVDISPRSREDVRNFWWVAPDRVMYTVAVHFGSIVNPQGTGELFTVKADGSDSNAIFGLRVSGSTGTASHLDQPGPDRASGSLVATLSDDPLHAIIASYPWIASAAGDVVPVAYKIDLRDGRKVQVATAPIRGGEFLADHQGVVRVVWASSDDANLVGKVYYRKGADSEWKLVERNDESNGFAPIMFDRRNETVYAGCREGLAICRWNPASGELKQIWSSKDSAEGFLVPTLDGQDAFAVRTVVGRPALAVLDRNAPEVALLVSLMKQFPGVDIQFVNASRDGRKIVFLAVADDDPGVFYLYDADTKKITKLVERRPWIKPQQMAQSEPIALKARDGLELNGFLTRPPGKAEAKDLPTVVMVHGGPYGVYDDLAFDDQVQLLATHGYAVLRVNFRGSGGKGSKFLAAGFHEWGAKMQDDITDATRWAIDQHIADPRRLCIYGVSYGGYAALEGAAREPDLYRCAIGYAGIYDLRRWEDQSDVGRSSSGGGYIRSVLGKNEADLASRSPIMRAGQIKAKVMLVVGGADERVPKEQGEAMRMALARAGNEPEWVYERTEGHGFYDEGHVADLYVKMLAFLDRNIGAGATDKAAK